MRIHMDCKQFNGALSSAAPNAERQRMFMFGELEKKEWTGGDCGLLQGTIILQYVEETEKDHEKLQSN
jgi:hypothetical protein